MGARRVEEAVVADVSGSRRITRPTGSAMLVEDVAGAPALRGRVFDPPHSLTGGRSSDSFIWSREIPLDYQGAISQRKAKTSICKIGPPSAGAARGRLGGLHPVGLFCPCGFVPPSIQLRRDKRVLLLTLFRCPDDTNQIWPTAEYRWRTAIYWSPTCSTGRADIRP
jgi:hypothetical protein